MIPELNINQVLENLPIVNPNRQYWLVRTLSGNYYEVFRDNGFVAIGWNEIPIADLAKIHESPENEELKNTIKNKITVEGEPGSLGVRMSQAKAISQLLKFAYDIKQGDIVIIPSENSDLLSFGEVVSTPLEVAHDGVCGFTKRKRILWIRKDIRRLSLDSNLYRFIFAHQTVNNVTEYSEYINNTLFDFYTVDGRASLVLRVKTNEAIDPFKMETFYSDLLLFIRKASEYNGEEIRPGDISVKFDLQSPGLIIFGGIVAFGLLMIGAFTVLAGGEHDIEFDPKEHKFKFHFKSNSLLDKISDFLDRSLEREEKKRASRLLQELRDFEVEKNKNLSSLIESSREKLDNPPADKRQDSPEI